LILTNSSKIPDRTKRGFQQSPALVLPALLAQGGDSQRGCSGVGLLRVGSHPQPCCPAPWHAIGSPKAPGAPPAPGFLLTGWELWSFSLKDLEVVSI